MKCLKRVSRGLRSWAKARTAGARGDMGKKENAPFPLHKAYTEKGAENLSREQIYGQIVRKNGGQSKHKFHDSINYIMPALCSPLRSRWRGNSAHSRGTDILHR